MVIFINLNLIFKKLASWVIIFSSRQFLRLLIIWEADVNNGESSIVKDSHKRGWNQLIINNSIHLYPHYKCCSVVNFNIFYYPVLIHGYLALKYLKLFKSPPTVQHYLNLDHNNLVNVHRIHRKCCCWKTWQWTV